MPWGWIGAGVSIIGSIIGGNKQDKAARQQANAQNAATDAAYNYDIQKWELDQEKIIADRRQAVEVIETQARNEIRTAQYRDAINLSRYNYDLQIRNRQQESLNQQYLRSDDIFRKQLSLNAMAAQAARQDELRKYQEIQAEASFDLQEARIQRLQEEDKMRARGMSGRSVGKLSQATYADLGRRIAMVNESIAGAGRNTRAVIQEISRDKASADLAAFSQKMLDPGVLPMPIVPFKTPMAEFIYPREIIPADYGPHPVRGAYASPSAASNQVWGSTISGIAGLAGPLIATIQ